MLRNHPPLKVLSALVISIFLNSVAPINSQADSLVINNENDFFGSAGTDRYYTNGGKITVIPEKPPQWADQLGDKICAWEKREMSQRKIAFSVGQNIYTPRDIERTDLIADDRPYGGWLYLGMGIHDRTDSRLDTNEIILGMVGPQSYARDVQIFWHERVIGLNNTREPSGWNNQLKNEFGVVLLRERKWRIYEHQWKNGFGFDCITHLGGALGNIHTYANTGGEVRYGFSLPTDFGTSQSRPAGDASGLTASDWQYPDNPFAAHIFLRIDGRGVARNIFLDGNTFTDSHSVDRKLLVGNISAGINLTLWKGVNLTYTHVYQTKEFDQQDLAHVYGSISLAITY
ncbi:MAG: lipid A deacylase LpxR family protein [Desulfobulbaceae bacterium]|nr:lipid A deacylase LpxR family protein [Desulfobulbaceae bacterium]